MASLNPELIAEISGFPITNTTITTIVVDIVILALVVAIYKKISLVPRGIYKVAEPAIEILYDFALPITGKKNNVIFPWFASFFLFILIANSIALLPGFGSIGFWEIVHNGGHEEKHLIPLLRAATADFNLVMALGAVSVVMTHIISIYYNGIVGYLLKFLSLNPINLMIGLLEFALEGVKALSLALRLFGNIYAGEVVLVTVSGLAAFLAPVPFLLLESIVAIVQALVFAALTMAFMAILATTKQEGGH